MTRPLCIYHGNCADGFSAAWVVWRYTCADQQDGYPGTDFHPGIYGQAPPDVTGRDVIMVDFSYKRPVLEEMAKKANSILILDHHKTAAADLDGFWIPPVEYRDFLDHVAPGLSQEGLPPVNAIFDMHRSGATITWDYFFKGTPRPRLLEHVEDRDLWLFKLDGTREIQANVFSYPYDFKVWDRLMRTDPVTMIPEGAAIERKHHKDVAELVGVSWRKMVIGGHLVPIANLPYTLTSDAGHMMCRGLQDTDGTSWIPRFAGCYWDTPAGRTFSLRSTDEGLDVSEIAKAYGGGGHRNASGFTMPRGWEGDDKGARHGVG